MNSEMNWLLNEGEGPKSRNILRLNRAEAELLWSYSTRAKVRMIEIGRCYGGSACLMSAAAPDVMLDSFDLTMRLHAKSTEFLCNRKVSLRLANSQTVKFSDLYDLAFIDGDHSYEGVKGDFENLAPHLAAEAVILFHDAVSGAYGTCDGVRKFTEELLKNGRVKRLSVADSMLAVSLL